ncbi:putative EH domain-containing protein [Helianthus annuus]|nr:putative EH domain-containing protein [Helianthus annuus]
MVTVSAPIASCSKAHQKIYQQWFNYVDSDGDGRVTGDDATVFFAKSNVEKPQLKQVWAIADSKRQGFLGFNEFITAMQASLIYSSFLQSSDLYSYDVELLEPPVMEGLDLLLAVSIHFYIDTYYKCYETLSCIDAFRFCHLQKHNGSRNNGVPETNGVLAVQPAPAKSLFTSMLSKKSSCHTSLGKVTSIVDGLKRLYNEKLKPLEVAYRYNDFASPLLTNTDFDAKPMVMLLGQYSTGKTTFIKHLLKSNYPGESNFYNYQCRIFPYVQRAHIGPEPTTDRFIVVMGGPDERSVPGNTIAVHADMPFNTLTTFGGAFLSKFECSQMPHPLLEHITFVDTPGVLSGEKQRTQRSYDFTGVIKWFAEKCDLILLLFDPHKLDISDEFKRVISSLHGQEDKIRVVLNKADQVDTQQLMRVYGALMWSLGKVLNTPEVTRVYVGSFNDKPVNKESLDSMGKELFEKEQDDLLVDLMDIPKKACDRQINEFVKRARAAKIHAYIISQLKKEMPAMMGKSKAQQKLMKNLEDVFAKVQREFHLPAGDFPDVEHFRQVLGAYNIDKFEKLKPKMIQAVDEMLGYDIPDLLKNFKNPYE